ncbi:MAG: hypothetical protein ACT4OE_00745 [Sphingosinicella sp.]
MMRLTLCLAAALAIGAAACTREEQESVAEKFDRQAEELQQKAKAIEASVENEVSALEDRLENEADILVRNVIAGEPRNQSEAQNKSR